MKKTYIEKQKERLEQKIKVLVNRPAFQQEILDLRKKWKIPVEGINNEEDKEGFGYCFIDMGGSFYDRYSPLGSLSDDGIS